MFIVGIAYLVVSLMQYSSKVTALRLNRQNRLAYARRLLSSQSASSSAHENLYPNFAFDIIKSASDSKARLGLLKTPHGTVQTPNFIFCATRGAMKALTPEQLRAEGSQIILSNTYHMMLAPGADLVERLGGLQKFTAWNGPMFTDSGGYQIFSMGHGTVANEIKGNRGNSMRMSDKLLLGIDEEGAVFRSYVDGSVHKLTPEKSIDIQRKLGADLIVVLDECTPFNVEKNYTIDSMRRSHRWAERSLDEFKRTNTGKQALYGIVQGGVYHELRDESTHFINTHDFFGTAIGGSLGNTRKGMHDIVAYTRGKVRDDRPVHLLGIGGVLDIFNGVRHGIDTFDCVAPMRLARHGGALVMAAHWDEEIHPDCRRECDAEAEFIAMREAVKKISKEETRRRNTEARLSQTQRAADRASRDVTPSSSSSASLNDAINSEPSMPESESDVPVDLSVECHPIFLQELAKQRKKMEHSYQRNVVSDHVKLKFRLMKHDPRPIDPTCSCYTCRNFSRAYLRHCVSQGEQVGGMLISIHNAHFMNRLFKDIRDGIQNDNLDEVEARYVHPELRAAMLAEAPTKPSAGDIASNTDDTHSLIF